MSGRTKPKRARRYAARTNPFEQHRAFNTLLTPAERASKLNPPRNSLQQLRTKAATYRDYVELCTVGHNAMAIEDGGVITGQRQIIDEALDALEQIGRRAGAPARWTTPTCYGPELVALQDLWHAYSRQLHTLTYAEHKAAEQRALARVVGAQGRVVRPTE